MSEYVTKEQIIEFLHDLGYEISLRPDNKNKAINVEFNVRLLWNKSDEEYYNLTVYTRRSGHTNTYTPYPINNEPITNELLAYIKSIRGYVKNMTLDTLPDPFPYKQKVYVERDGYHIHNLLLHKIRVIKMCGITHNLHLSEEILSDRNTEPWYLISGLTFAGDTVEFITTDKYWYPIHMISKKVTTDVCPQNGADLTDLSLFDYELIEKAIRAYHKNI